MTNQHPITPPPDLVQQWYNQADKLNEPFITYIATRAAQYGAKQQLKACWEWLNARIGGIYPDELRSARRKPPSLKELALQKLAWIEDENPGDQATFDTIRRALETLPE